MRAAIINAPGGSTASPSGGELKTSTASATQQDQTADPYLPSGCLGRGPPAPRRGPAARWQSPRRYPGIHQRTADGLAGGEDFGPPQNHAVGDDDLHKQGNAAVQVEGVGLQHHDREGGEGGDDQHEAGQSGFVGNDASEQ